VRKQGESTSHKGMVVRNIAGSRDLEAVADGWQVFADDFSVSVLREKYLSWLSETELERYEGIRATHARHEYLCAHVLCRAALSQYSGTSPADWGFTAGPRGKPRLAGHPASETLRFSLTHTRDLAICLVSRDGEVGVDAEETTRPVDVESVVKYFFTTEEQSYLQRLPRAQRLDRYYKQWVLREAYLKGTGEGIAGEPEQFAVRFDADGQPLPLGEWQLFFHRPSERHVAAAAVRPTEPRRRIGVRWLDGFTLFEKL
jgi:4'-phosphopantetheinyl transferase